jgi:hypothetical protein
LRRGPARGGGRLARHRLTPNPRLPLFRGIRVSPIRSGRVPRDDRRRAGYAFPHADGDESRRFQLLEERLDPTTIRRIERLGLVSGARSLEVGAGRGSIARWLCGHVGPGGR